MTERALHIRRLGLVEYEDGLAMQQQLAAARHAGLVPDTLLLLEHPRTLTLGRAAASENILWSKERLDALGFERFETNRGGDVTYHGPGQLVGYPILDLKPDRRDVRRYVASIEELMIRTARDFGIEAERVAGRTGIWVRGGAAPDGRVQASADGKLGAIGVHLSRWITTHGFAFNVSTRLEDFAAIVPCGIADAGVCSVESLLSVRGQSAPAMSDVERRALAHAAALWESEPFEVPHELETISAAIVREGLHGDELLLMRRTPERGGFWQLITGRRERGEPAHAAAAREIFEETGFSPRLEELIDLDYAHSFALAPAPSGDDSRAAVTGPLPARPLFCREQAFALRVDPSSEPLLSPEHDAYRWLQLDDALTLLPFPGLRRTASLAFVHHQSSLHGALAESPRLVAP